MKYKNLAYSWAYALLNPNPRTKQLWQIPKFNSIKSSVQKTQINSIRKKNLFQIRIPFGVQIRKRKNIFLIKKIPFAFAIVSMYNVSTLCLHKSLFCHLNSGWAMAGLMTVPSGISLCWFVLALLSFCD